MSQEELVKVSELRQLLRPIHFTLVLTEPAYIYLYVPGGAYVFDRHKKKIVGFIKDKKPPHPKELGALVEVLEATQGMGHADELQASAAKLLVNLVEDTLTEVKADVAKAAKPAA